MRTKVLITGMEKLAYYYVDTGNRDGAFDFVRVVRCEDAHLLDALRQSANDFAGFFRRYLTFAGGEDETDCVCS